MTPNVPEIPEHVKCWADGDGRVLHYQRPGFPGCHIEGRFVPLADWMAMMRLARACGKIQCAEASEPYDALPAHIKNAIEAKETR